MNYSSSRHRSAHSIQAKYLIYVTNFRKSPSKHTCRMRQVYLPGGPKYKNTKMRAKLSFLIAKRSSRRKKVRKNPCNGGKHSINRLTHVKL